MKTLFASLLISSTFAAAPAFAKENHDLKPLHGGIVVEAKHVDYELVAKTDRISLHLRDHGKPIDVSKATAKLTLLAGSEKQEIELKPNANALEASGTFRVGKGTKLVAVVTNAGKVATVRFELK